MTDKKYNGWSNYETWVTKLWMDNDQGSYEHYKEMTLTFKEDAYGLSQAIKQDVEEYSPTRDSANLYADLLSAAISEIDFMEIAEALINEHSQESEDDKDFPPEEDVDYLRDIGEDK